MKNMPALQRKIFKYSLTSIPVLVLVVVWLFRGAGETTVPEKLQGLAVTPKAIGEVELVESSGKSIGTEDFHGKWTLVFFGFTNCPDVCPATLMQLAQLNKALHASRQNQHYQFLFVSVDPQRDTPARLREYVGYFDKDFLAASGEPKQIRKFEKIFDAFHRYEKRSDDDQHYNVTHSAAIFIVDAQARYVGKFLPPFDVRSVSERLAALNAYISRVEERA